MFRRRLVAAATFWLLAGPALALCDGPSLADTLTEAEARAVAEETAGIAYPEGLFWSATRDGRRIDLIGTMHVHDPRLAAVRDRALPLLEAAEVLYVEATRAEEAEMEATILAEPQRIFVLDGPTLPERLPEDEWRALAEAAEARMVPAFMAAKMRPWYLTIALAMPPCAMPDMIEGRRGLDHMLLDDAAEMNLEARALEPWETVLGLFADSPEADQLAMLRLSAAPPELQTEAFVAMLDGYFAGRIAEIWAMSRIAGYRTPGLDPAEADALMAATEDLLIVARNHAWIERLEAAEERRIAVAVGALHLPGEDGLLRLLEARGWRIAPL
jgi:hypothetical protein